MTTALRAVCRTEEQASRLRKAGYDVTIISSGPLEGDGKTPIREPSRGKGGVLEGKIAAQAGRQMGIRWQHDPWALCRNLGLDIRREPLANMQRPGTSGTVYGILYRHRDRPGQVQLAAGVTPEAERFILAHEAGHAMGAESEDDADLFAHGFLFIADDETPAGRWRIIKDEQLRRERERQRGRVFVRTHAASGTGVLI